MLKIQLVAAAVGGLLLAGYLAKDTPTVKRLLDQAPAVMPGSTAAQGGQVLTAPPTGVHKCELPGGGFTYSDRPCAHGSHEKAVTGGVVTVTDAPKPKPDPAASGAGLIQGFDQKTIDAMREKRIDDAMKR